MLTRALFKSLFSCSSPLQRQRIVSSSMRRTRFSCCSDSTRISSWTVSTLSAFTEEDTDAPPSDAPHGTSTDDLPESLSMSLPNATSDIFATTRHCVPRCVQSLQPHETAAISDKPPSLVNRQPTHPPGHQQETQILTSLKPK